MPRRTHPKSDPVMRLAIALTLVGLALGFAAGFLALVVVDQANANGECSWGASSILYEDGHVVAGPDLTGCAP
jgi:hypothetical protein